MQYPVRTGPIVNDQAPFSPEMVAGYHPDRPSLFLAPRIPLPLSQTTHVQAAFSPEMAAGWYPDRPRLFTAPRIPLPIFNPQLVSFSPEMVVGWHPDRPRLFLAPRIPLPLAQTTHVQASFSPEMVAGSHPDQPRLFLAPKIRSPFFDPSLPGAFSIEMVAGYHPDAPRLSLGPRISLPVLPPDIALFLLEFLGWHPDSPRLFLGPRLGLPISILEDILAPAPAVTGIIAPAGRPGGKKKKFKDLDRPENHRPPGTPLAGEWPGMIWPSEKKKEAPVAPKTIITPQPPNLSIKPHPELAKAISRIPGYKAPEFYRSPLLNYAAASRRERIIQIVRERMQQDKDDEDLLLLLGDD